MQSRHSGLASGAWAAAEIGGYDYENARDAIPCLRQIVAPALRDAAEWLQSEGYRASVVDASNQDETPLVQLQLQVLKKGFPVVRPCVLDYRWTRGNQIHLSIVIRTFQGESERKTEPKPTMLISQRSVRETAEDFCVLVFNCLTLEDVTWGGVEARPLSFRAKRKIHAANAAFVRTLFSESEI